MIKHGKPPYLECSSSGNVRFSAFCASIKSRINRTIEEIYQGSKVVDDGSTGLSWRMAKGRKAVNQKYVSELYSKLWDEYIAENPDLMYTLMVSSGLSDKFGQQGHVCQATELWRIRNSSRKVLDFCY